ncbi:type II secretion system F family protein [Pelomonas sp. SE-A7]|uniref:type II secretion system F family protein n=1 Tax=Pelomonas sp. SE-A7 TaxID=3054953 RepID=UPI00259CE7B4|nr:type II secretion system F family protein [Pelomonas sp. SE-A7]MDM4767785.1 type II secretion system F family protein [Pelomonas sp. SE-A7]
MPHFAYTARSGSDLLKGVLEAGSPAEVVEVLRGRGHLPVSITPAKAPTSADELSLSKLFERWTLPAVGTVDLMLMSRQLHTLLRSGVPILRALAGLQESATHQRLKDTLLALRQSLESGIDFATSLAQHPAVFSGFYVALVRVGEMTGRLDEVLLRLYTHLEFELFMSQQVKAALRYPMFVGIAMAIAIGVINVMVIPAFAGVFKSFNAELPLATRILLATSNFTIEFGWLLVLLGIAAFFGWKRWTATPAGELWWDEKKLRLPLAGKIVKKAMLARMARSLSLSLKSGVPVEQALTVVAQTVENKFMQGKVEKMRESVERGDSILRSAAASGVFTPVVLQMVAVGEETGALDELLEEVGALYSNEVQYELKTLSQQIEPILIVFLGVLVLILALGVFLPIWDLGRVAMKR